MMECLRSLWLNVIWPFCMVFSGFAMLILPFLPFMLGEAEMTKSVADNRD